MPKVLVDDSKGLYQTSGKGVVGLMQSKVATGTWSSGSKIVSSAISIPAGSLIKDIHIVVTTALAGTGIATVKGQVGTSSSDASICVAKNLGATLTNGAVIAGKGQSTSTELNTALAGSEALVISASQKAYQTSDIDLYVWLQGFDNAGTPAATDFTAGAFKVSIDFITFA